MPIAVPVLDLARQWRALEGELLAALRAVLASGQYIGGAEVEALENEIAARLGVRCAVALNSGTDALHLALRAAGIGPGDEVITSPFTFVATASAICHAGARPVFADIDAATFNLSPAAVERALTPRTRALLPVHIFGQPADMAELLALATRHRLIVIEDCAQSFGASYRGRATGTFGLAGAFSFYPTKNLGANGDGGMAITDSADFAQRLRRLANHGVGAPQQYVELGFNSRLDALQAALLRVKLRYAEACNDARRRIAARYGELLRDLPLRLPTVAADRTHVFHQYAVLVPRRDEVAAELRRQGIGTAIHYARPLYRQPALAPFAPPTPLPVVEDVCRRCLCLPMFAQLEARELEAVAVALAHALAN